MTNKPSDTKKKNTNVTAQSTSDPSGSQPVYSPSQNDPDPQNDPSPSQNSGKTKSAPLQPDPQHSDPGDPDPTQSNSPSTPSDDQPPSGADPSALSQPPSGTDPSTPSQPPSGTDRPSQSQTQSVPASGRPPQQQPPQSTTPSQSPYGGFDDWGFDDPFGDMDDAGGGFGNDTGGGFGGGFGGNSSFGRGAPGTRGTGGRTSSKRMTPEERVKMIERVYNEILQRKPDTRDINYYKYSTLSEEQIRKQLITSAEHTDMIKKGREYKDIKEQAEQLESRVRMLEGQLKDHVEEFRELSNLLQEKNRLIQELRSGNARLRPHPQKGPIRAEEAAQPLPHENTATGTHTPGPRPPRTSEEQHQHRAAEPSPLTPSATIPEQPDASTQTTVSGQPATPEGPPTPEQPATLQHQTGQTPLELQQTKPPINELIFTEEHGAPPPPDIETENGIITGEQNSPGRRIKRSLRELLGSFLQ